jgi:hypothetical protein
VKFEHACHAIQFGIIGLLACAGLQNQGVAQIIVAGLTAEPLRKLFQSLVAQSQILNDNEKKILNIMLKRFQELTNERNDIIHSMWFVGWGDENTTDFSQVKGMKYHKNETLEVLFQRRRGFRSRLARIESLELHFLTPFRVSASAIKRLPIRSPKRPARSNSLRVHHILLRSARSL